MVSNPDVIGRLIANETLLKGERQLLRGEAQSQQQAQNGSVPSAAPLTHNDKAVAAVLLTLLDEQLDASAASSAVRPNAPSLISNDAETASSSNRIAARYVDDDLGLRSNSLSAGASVPGLTSQQIAQAASSPDLQAFIQRFLMSAAARIQTGGVEGLPRRPRSHRGLAPNRALSTMQIAGALLAIAVVIIVAAHFAG